MLSMRAKYGLRALASLAKEYGKGPLLISDISSRERIPKKFLVHKLDRPARVIPVIILRTS